jgi:hypothetical protein
MKLAIRVLTDSNLDAAIAGILTHVRQSRPPVDSAGKAGTVLQSP